MTIKSRPFFVGYGTKMPKGIATLILPVFALFVSSFTAFSLLLSSKQGAPGDGRFRGDLGPQNIVGIVEYHPYPVIRVPARDGEPAHTLILSGNGKRGVFSDALEYRDKAVNARGIFLKRGDLTMLQVNVRRSMTVPLSDLPAAFEPAAPKNLGRWKISGEVCDGKCYAGAMRPGVGLAHKACANLCISGGVPAVFVSTSPVEGHEFFLLADQDGKPLGDELYDLVALLIEAEGQVEKLDDLAVFRMDLSTVKILP